MSNYYPGGSLHVAGGLCWNLQQLTQAIEQYDSRNEMVKLEVVHDFAPGRKCYNWTIFYRPMPDDD